MTERPTGVTILAIWYLIGGVVGIGSGIICILLIDSGFLEIFEILLPYAGFPESIIFLLVVVIFIGAILSFIIGWGLWRLRPWARIMVLAFEVIGIISAVIGMSIYGILINVIIIWYLLKPEVKAAFQATHFRPETHSTPTTDKTLDVYLPTDALKGLDSVTPIHNIEEVGKYAECPYCGSNIRDTFYELGGIVRCVKCGAFHHRECFEYYGGKCGSSSCKLMNA